MSPPRIGTASSWGITAAVLMSVTDPGVDAADQRIDQRLDDAAALSPLHQGSERAVAERPAAIVAREHGVAQQPGRAGRPEDPRARRRPPPGRHAEHQSLGEGAEPAAGVHGGARGADRDERVAEADLPAELRPLRSPPEEPVGADVDRGPGEDLRVQRAPEAPRRLEHDDPRRSGVVDRAAGQLPGRGQAGDPAAHHDDRRVRTRAGHG